VKLKTFIKGGVHPPENKISAGEKIVEVPLPKTVYVPVQQVLGAPSVPVVKKGDRVKTGQLIAKGEAFISANVHSPATGTVSKIEEVTDSSGYRKTTIIIDTEADEWEEGIITDKGIQRECTLSPEEIISKIKSAGIVGMGGATFPTHVKLMVPPDKKAELLLLTGVECEPSLTSDHRLMLERGEELMAGIQILMKALKVEKAIIGIENNKKDAIAHLDALSRSFSGISVQALKVKYPQGGEKQLIKAITGREVPSGKLPVEVGCVVQNVGTAVAVYEAVQKNKPLIERIVTVSGFVSHPANYLARIGTPVSVLLELSGGIPEKAGKIINGGPMMGKAVNNTEVPVTKGTSGILVFPEDVSLRHEPITCIRCSKCVQACPMSLEPYYLAQLSEIKDWEKCEKNMVMDCIECGSCMYVCPSYRPLLDYIRMGKTQVGKIIRSRVK